VNISKPNVRFYRAIPSAQPPQRCDRSALGTIPTRAFRSCEALTTAAAFGWYAFPPMELYFLWDGNDIFWSDRSTGDWIPLTSVQFPNLSAQFDNVAPSHLRGCAPPMLTSIPEPGIVQIWTGLFARCGPGWSLLIRPPANLPLPGGYAMFEGVVQADTWFGPLFTNLRLTRTNSPICLRGDFPLVQIQPIPNFIFSNSILNDVEIIDTLSKFQDVDWYDYNLSVAGPSNCPERPPGQYATRVRKERAKYK
jgi:hypothetical protein